MPFWILDKKSNIPAVSGSIKNVAKYTGINLNKLYRMFSRDKLSAFENTEFKIVKLNILKSKDFSDEQD